MSAQPAQSLPPSPTPPPFLGSELERRAAEVRAQRAKEQGEHERFTAQQRAEQATFTTALGIGCPEHNAPPGKPCWKLPPDERQHRAGRGVCGARIAQAVGIARLRREREERERQAEQEPRRRTKTTTTTNTTREQR